MNQNDNDIIVQKTRELCQTIIDHPNVVSARQRIDAFLEDPAAQQMYQGLVAKGQSLQQKQEGSGPLSDAEIQEFEAQRAQLLENPVARGFIDAQEHMRSVHHSVTKYLSMTLESGRVPTPEDMESASCGHGCNCSH